MPHRSLSSIVFAGMVPTTAATVISLLGDDGLPSDIRIVENLMYHPWQTHRSGLLVMGMNPATDLTKVSSLIQERTTWWEVTVCLSESIKAYEPALLAQGAIKVIQHPEDDLTGCRDELRNLLTSLAVQHADLLGLELSDLIQLYGEKRLPKTIRVSGQGVMGSLFLRNGNLVHAETMDEDEGMSAFTRLFAVRSPDIRVHNGCLTARSTINQSAMAALMEGARVHDEDSREARPAPGSGDAYSQHSANAPGGNRAAGALGDIFEELDYPGSSSTEIRKPSFDADFDQ